MPIRRVVRHMTAYAEAPEDARRVIAPTAEVDELRDGRRGAAVDADPADRRAAAEGAAGAAGRRGGQDQPRPAQHPDHGAAFRRPDRGQRRPGGGAGGAQAGRLDQPGGVACANRRWPSARPRSRRRNCAALRCGRWSTRWPRARGWRPERPVTCLIDVPPGLMIRADQRAAVPRAVQPGPQRPAGDRGDGRSPAPSRSSAARTRQTGGSGSATPAPACRPRRASICSRRSRAARARAASGLGLAIAAELVRGHGGRLELVRSDAEGTEFVIRLPKDDRRPDADCGRRPISPLQCPGARGYIAPQCGPVAQLDRASDYESEGRAFESLRVRHLPPNHRPQPTGGVRLHIVPRRARCPAGKLLGVSSRLFRLACSPAASPRHRRHPPRPPWAARPSGCHRVRGWHS